MLDHDGGRYISTERRELRLSEQAARRLEQVRARLRGKSSNDVVEDAIDLYSRLRNPGDMKLLEGLTPRQREVLQLIVEEHTTSRIASKLRISIKTAEFHTAQLKKRLRISSRVGLIRFAIRVGVILP